MALLGSSWQADRELQSLRRQLTWDPGWAPPDPPLRLPGGCLPCSGREVDADANGSWYARESRNEATAFEHLHHLIDTRCRDQEVPLNVRLSRCSAKAVHVLGNESEVFELPLGGTLRRVRCFRRNRILHAREQLGARFNVQNGAV